MDSLDDDGTLLLWPVYKNEAKFYHDLLFWVITLIRNSPYLSLTIPFCVT